MDKSLTTRGGEEARRDSDADSPDVTAQAMPATHNVSATVFTLSTGCCDNPRRRTVVGKLQCPPLPITRWWVLRVIILRAGADSPVKSISYGNISRLIMQIPRVRKSLGWETANKRRCVHSSTDPRAGNAFVNNAQVRCIATSRFVYVITLVADVPEQRRNWNVLASTW